MATGPCGNEFREAFSCFHYSQEEQKGSDCFDQFKTMQQCMSKYPTLYDTDNDKNPLEDVEEEEEADPAKAELGQMTGMADSGKSDGASKSSNSDTDNTRPSS